jgi:diadenosine tetraphosphatase ApaH/serine/threonine PP2A family protein phosphatase
VQAQFDAFDTDVCFVGHSHRPAVASNHIGVTRVRPGHRFLINVGSVGQPRDGDPRAAFGLFDTDTMAYELVRVHYDLARTQARVAARGLPPSVGERLSRGA